MPNTAPELSQQTAAGGPVAVVKVGGAPLHGGADTTALAQDLQRVLADGWRVVVVHGGGSQLNDLMGRLGLQPSFVDGLRFTDDDVLSAAVMAFMAVNTQLAAALVAQGVKAVGMAGSAGGLVTAKRRYHRPQGQDAAIDLGWVGDVAAVRRDVIDSIWTAGCLPVIAPLALGVDGHLYNVNADTIAASLAAGLTADQCLLLTDVPGLLTVAPGEQQPGDETEPEVIRRLAADQAAQWLDEGRLTGGMRPKIAAALTAAQGGVAQVRIVDGREPGVITRHLLEGADDGTVILGGKNR